MAELIDPNELDNLDSTVDENEQPQEETTAQQAAPVDDLPEKYKGKSLADIARMHQEAEKLIGRQAQEVHEVRSLADQLLKQQLAKNNEVTPTEESFDDAFFADPKQAVAKAVEKHPAVHEARQAALELKKMKASQLIATKHPDFAQIAGDEGFQQWVQSSSVRSQLFRRADMDYDVEAADELLSTYKELKQIKAETTAKVDKEINTVAQDAAMKAVSVDVGGTGESSRKIYRRADLIKLRMTDPDRYIALQPEIMQAYAEGRVK